MVFNKQTSIRDFMASTMHFCSGNILKFASCSILIFTSLVIYLVKKLETMIQTPESMTKILYIGERLAGWSAIA